MGRHTAGPGWEEEELPTQGPEDEENLLRGITLHESVGVGRTAEVFRGSLRGRNVAVKRFATDKLEMSSREKLNLKRELAVLQDINHPLLVRFVGLMSTQTHFSLVTEFCEGGCVFELVHNCDEIELAWCQQVKMILDVAKAMDFLHSQNPPIIHRDLKSLNLLLTKKVLSEAHKPHVKVSDFGEAKAIISGPTCEPMTKAVGTQHWMAPEVLASDSYNEKIDVYSYAMILFEVLCREMPFEDKPAVKVALIIMRGIRPDLAAVPPDCPQELSALMIACWAQDAALRPSFREVVDLLVPVASKVDMPSSWR